MNLMMMMMMGGGRGMSKQMILMMGMIGIIPLQTAMMASILPANLRMFALMGTFGVPEAPTAGIVSAGSTSTGLTTTLTALLPLLLVAGNAWNNRRRTRSYSKPRTIVVNRGGYRGGYYGRRY